MFCYSTFAPIYRIREMEHEFCQRVTVLPCALLTDPNFDTFFWRLDFSINEFLSAFFPAGCREYF